MLKVVYVLHEANVIGKAGFFIRPIHISGRKQTSSQAFKPSVWSEAEATTFLLSSGWERLLSSHGVTSLFISITLPQAALPISGAGRAAAHRRLSLFVWPQKQTRMLVQLKNIPFHGWHWPRSLPSRHTVMGTLVPAKGRHVGGNKWQQGTGAGAGGNSPSASSTAAAWESVVGPQLCHLARR